MKDSVDEASYDPLIVAFMGLDGVGKSTQSAALETELAARGRRPLYVHHSSTKVPGLRALKQRYHGAAVRILGRRRAHASKMHGNGERVGRGGLIAWIVSMYFLAGSYLKSLWYPRRTDGKALILDRCFLDDVVKVRWRLGVETRVSRLLMQAVPKPTVVVVLEGEPAQTFQRKKAATCTFEEYLEKRRVLELTLEEAGQVGWVVERVNIDGRGVEEILVEVIQIVEEYSHAPEGRTPGKPLGSDQLP